MLVHCIISLVIGSTIYLNVVLFCQNTINGGGGGGGGGVAFSQFWTQVGSWSCE